MALVVKDAEGEVHETADHFGRKGVKAGAGVASSSGYSLRRSWRRPLSAPPPAV